ncbi:MAG: ABC transporter ATP-binding protein [Rhodobacteraceae bacterium]|jgi:branched-chain amino acid transport system ATP-binding protein|nr:MAG: ABC transporter ATP-binding protein [Paracoccaceae bacterium]|tara:strand:- start:537 stop:1244 length:708 start_codon:yes stop_codon:yes gene_type:complete
MLSLRNISKSFGGVKAVSDVSLEIEKGDVLGLIGPNGAGKSTLINLISGLLAPDNGAIYLSGKNITSRKSYERARLGLARTFQNLRIYPNLTVGQNIEVAEISSQYSERKETKNLDEIIHVFDLSDKADLASDELSYGHLRRLEIVRALALNPLVLLLDEPAAGMNENETQELSNSLRWVQENNSCAIIVIDHDLKFIMGVCDKITVMNMGEVIASGKPNEISNDARVKEAYIGH